MLDDLILHAQLGHLSLDGLHQLHHRDFWLGVADVVRFARQSIDQHLKEATNRLRDVAEGPSLLARTVDLNGDFGQDFGGSWLLKRYAGSGTFQPIRAKAFLCRGKSAEIPIVTLTIPERRALAALADWLRASTEDAQAELDDAQAFAADVQQLLERETASGSS